MGGLWRWSRPPLISGKPTAVPSANEGGKRERRKKKPIETSNARPETGKGNLAEG
ncbi:hypothetical protein HPP92_017409 [Vanilla planifolia]|uniref:Uncharacterized protein n=1 Tax=Vanilla planifolia TaxID=51239 RepID=A0A835Q7Y3_VANPL|nr:hypothetical protein HPP92_017409 [Vanilla planifolia]